MNAAHRATLAISCGLVAIATSTAASAQAQSAPPADPALTPAASTSASRSGVAALPVRTSTGATDDIVVTARRREENVQSVPVAITAFSQRSLERRGISDPYSLDKAVPGLTTTSTSGAGNLPSFSIRGRGTFFGAASGSVETYFADVPLSSPFETPSLPPQFFDLQSLQVLKGPQGTLFGRNSTGGAVLFVPQAPTDEIGGYIRVQGGTYDDLQVEGAVNLPFSDKVMLRVAGYEWHRKGYTRTLGGAVDGAGTVLSPERIDNQDVTEARATLLLKPTENFTNSTIFTYHTDKDRGSPQAIFLKGPGGVPIPITGPAASPRVIDTDVNMRRTPSNTWAVINTTTYDLTDNLTLKNIVAHIHAAGLSDNPADPDGTAAAAVDTAGPPRLLHNFQTTEELQLQGHAFDNKIDYIVGGLLDLTRQPGSNGDINIYTLSYPASGPTVPLGYDEQFRQSRYTSKSAFGSITWHITDKLSATGGVRRIYDSVSERTLEYVTNPPDVTANPSLVPGGYNTLSHKWKGWSYNGSIEYHPASGTMVYGGYRRGYKRGGFNARPPSPDQAIFNPETVDDYYIGLKQDLDPVGVRGHINIEGFYDIYHGAQRTYLTFVDYNNVEALATVVNNAEKTTYRGFDMDFVAEATPWLELSGNYTFVDAYYNKYTDNSVTDPAELAALGNPSTSLAMNPPGLVSKHKMSVTARFHKVLSDGSEIALAPSLSYQSRYFINDQSVRQPNSSALLFLGGANLNSKAFGTDIVQGYKLVDFRVEWNKVRGSNIDLAINGNNVLNKTYKTGGAGIYVFGFESVSFGPPRMFTAEARIHF
jgi:iron complex outermembrane receptor protein